MSDYDSSFSKSMTSKDTIVLYEAFTGLFAMLKYSNTEYYKSNPGYAIIKIIHKSKGVK